MTTFALTPAAKTRIATLLKEEDGAMALRVAVLGGGCSGFQYEFSFAKAHEEGDLMVDNAVVIDPTSLELLSGATLDYVDDLGGSFFRINNPQATSSCGCGNSFSA